MRMRFHQILKCLPYTFKALICVIVTQQCVVIVAFLLQFYVGSEFILLSVWTHSNAANLNGSLPITCLEIVEQVPKLWT